MSDQYTDEKFVERIEVAVSREEVDMIEKEFHRPYWAWELPHAARRGVTVSALYSRKVLKCFERECLIVNSKYF